MARVLLRLAVLALVATVAAFLGFKKQPRDAARGAVLFAERCAVCHSTDDRGGQGPGLAGVFGRHAGRANGFAYSKPLRASGLTWDAPTLDAFLAAPGRLVPGTTMPIATPDETERRELVAYLATLRPAPATVATSAGSSALAVAAPPGLRTGGEAFGDYRDDGPGVRRHITVGDLPKPYASHSSRNNPSVVEPPAGARPLVPPGYSVAAFARDLDGPRILRVAPNGDLFVAETAAGKILVLRAKDGATAPSNTEIFATGLDAPFGIAFYPPGANPSWVYVANNNAVVRFAYAAGDLRARAAPETIVPKLTDSSGGHSTRDIVFSADGAKMFVSIGSGSNVAESLPKKSASESAAWDAAHGLGAAWGDETNRADVMLFDPDGKNGRVFASGIRNCVGLAISPETHDLYCSTNERDALGDDLVPDYVTRVKPGAFYGWPWYYMGDHEDPRHAGERPDLLGKVTVPDVLLQPHSASLGLTFYEGSMFPAEMRGDGFAAFHGSWNRELRTGPKVVRIVMKDGVPTGEYEDFMTGFTVDNERVWGRPVGVAVAHDGALLVGEDANGTIWRVEYDGK
jgi:glucose/arabinose dehydrogenase